MRLKFYHILINLGIGCILISCMSSAILTPTIIASLTPDPTGTAEPSRTPEPARTEGARPAEACRVFTGVPEGHLNLRKGPDEASSIITVLEEGQIIRPLDSASAGWIFVMIEASQLCGYVNITYTTCQEER
jgi:hypothetical protein